LLQGSASVIFALLMGIVGVIYVLWQLRNVLSYDEGNDTMRSIAKAIQEGASAFLNREYRFLAIFVAIVAIIIIVFLEWQTAASFVVGAIASGGAGYLGMYVAAHAKQAAEMAKVLRACEIAYQRGTNRLHPKC
jgi:K(+)-stimulated pyrophosphate-energized sodium pump